MEYAWLGAQSFGNAPLLVMGNVCRFRFAQVHSHLCRLLNMNLLSVLVAFPVFSVLGFLAAGGTGASMLFAAFLYMLNRNWKRVLSCSLIGIALLVLVVIFLFADFG
jgi:hypothetical protein